MIFQLSDPAAFTSSCLEAWHENSEFWSKTRQINPTIKKFIDSTLRNLIVSKNGIQLVDIGCGNGWLYEDVTRGISGISYHGVDFNDYFIKELQRKFPENNYYCLDFDKPIKFEQFPKFNVAVSCLSIIEMPDITQIFKNIKSILSPDGILILITLNPYFEIIRLNESYDALKNDLTIFRSNKGPKYYRKEIFVAGKSTDKHYYGVLHPIESFMHAIFSSGFCISDLKELNFLDGCINEPVYHAYTLFIKDKYEL